VKNVVKELRRALRLETLVQTQVGVDQNGEYKVYEGLAPSDTDAPYISIFQQPGGDLIATYGQHEGMLRIALQFTCWGHNSTQAWEVWDALFESMDHVEPQLNFEPWTLVHLLPSTVPQEIPDADTDWRQVVTRYQLAYAK
jgi:hypothetical protein